MTGVLAAVALAAPLNATFKSPGRLCTSFARQSFARLQVPFGEATNLCGECGARAPKPAPLPTASAPAGEACYFFLLQGTLSHHSELGPGGHSSLSLELMFFFLSVMDLMYSIVWGEKLYG